MINKCTLPAPLENSGVMYVCMCVFWNDTGLGNNYGYHLDYLLVPLSVYVITKSLNNVSDDSNY